MKKLLMFFLAIFIVGFPFASGHPFTDETIPTQFSNVPVGTSEIIVFFSEAVEIDFSSLKVFDSNGDQIDNRDTKYYEGESSLIVTTPPLSDGAYTVTSKVLSKVDGHLVDGAFVFAVGDVQLDPDQLENIETSELIFLPEAGARFPGLLGQTIVLGAIIASILVWGTQRKDIIKADLTKFQLFYQNKFMTLVGFGLIIVFASNILSLAVNAIRLEASSLDVLQTSFGMTWIIRMSLTIILLGLWFLMERMRDLSIKKQIPLLVFSLALIGTTTMTGHGTASEQGAAVILDYVHNLVAAIWIGGIIFFAFALLPSFSSLGEQKREKMSLLAIPRFSIMIVISIGIVIITGPTLLWLLESDVGMITESTYGKLIIMKILLAAGMIAIGAYHQFGIQKKAELNINSSSFNVHKKLKRALKVESGLGILLLAVVALLTNGSLPAGEIQAVQAEEGIVGFSTIEFSEQAKFDVQIFPFNTGSNIITVSVTDSSGNIINDLKGVKVKVSNPQRSIAPIEITMNAVEQSDEQVSTEFRGDLTFGFSGQWQVDIEAQRTLEANEIISQSLLIKPRLENLKVEIIEYDFPEPGTPLYPVYDGDGSIWISDSAAPVVWRFLINEQEFKKYEFEGLASISLKVDNEGKVWFTDIPASQIGYIDPKTDQVQTLILPKIHPVMQKSFPIILEADLDNNMWLSIINKNVLLKYEQNSGNFEESRLPTRDSAPFALVLGPDGKIWFTQQIVGQIGNIDPVTGEIKEIVPPTPLETPETMIFDKDGNIWIAEHQEGGAVTKFNPLLETFERIPAPDGAAFPNSVVFDRYDNVWFAQHTVDKLAVYDPHRNNLIEIPIPTEESWVQFTVADENDNVWFVEQKPYKLGMVKLTELPSVGIIQEEETKATLRYTEIASPLISLGIIVTSLFFVKSVRDKRRINDLIYSN